MITALTLFLWNASDYLAFKETGKHTYDYGRNEQIFIGCIALFCLFVAINLDIKLLFLW